MKHEQSNKKRVLPISLSKKLLIVFVLTVILTWAVFHYLPLIPALLCLTAAAALIYLSIERKLVKPLQALTLSVLESRPTPNGFEYHPPEIRSGDELELLNDALRRMADDINGKS